MTGNREPVVLNPRKFGGAVVAIGLLIIIMYPLLANTAHVVRFFSMPFAPFFLGIGTLFCLYNRPVIVRHRLTVLLLAPFIATRRRKTSDTQLYDYLQSCLSSKQLTDDASVPARFRTAFRKLLPGQGITYPNLEALFLDPLKRNELLLQLNLDPIRVEKMYADSLAELVDRLKYLDAKHDAALFFPLSVPKLGLVLIVSFAALFATMSLISSDVRAEMARRNLQAQFCSLLDDFQLTRQDYDQISQFLAACVQEGTDTETREAHGILTSIFSLSGDSVAENWDAAYQKYCDSNPPRHTRRDGGFGDRVLKPIWRLTGWGASEDTIRSYLYILKGKICARRSGYGNNPGDLARMEAFYDTALTLAVTGLALNGKAIALKYRAQHLADTSASLLRVLGGAQWYLERSSADQRGGSYRRAKYFNNMADLYLEIIHRLLRGMSIRKLLERDPGLSTENRRFWERMDSFNDSLVGLFEWAHGCIERGKLYYPVESGAMTTTLAQYHSLYAKFQSRLGRPSEAKQHLRVARDLIIAGLSRGFDDRSIFYSMNRERMYFDTFDLLDPWARGQLDSLRATLLTQFPQDRGRY